MNKKIKALLVRLSETDKKRNDVEKTSKYLLILSAVMALISNASFLCIVYIAAIVANIVNTMVKIVHSKNIVVENDVRWRYIMLGEYEFTEVFVWTIYILITGIIFIMFHNIIVFILLQLVGIGINPAITKKLAEWAVSKQTATSEEAEFDSE